jgi:hypothetical protein
MIEGLQRHNSWKAISMTSFDEIDGFPYPNYIELSLPDTLSVEEAVKFMIFANPSIRMSSAFSPEMYNEPFLKTLEDESKKLGDSYRSAVRDTTFPPVMLRANPQNLEKIVDHGMEYKNQLEREISRAKRKSSRHLALDSGASHRTSIDMLTADSLATWAEYVFKLKLGRFYIFDPSDPCRGQSDDPILEQNTSSVPSSSALNLKSSEQKKPQSEEALDLMLTMAWFLDIFMEAQVKNWQKVREDKDRKYGKKWFSGTTLNVSTVLESISDEFNSINNEYTESGRRDRVKNFSKRRPGDYVSAAARGIQNQWQIDKSISSNELEIAYRTLYGLARATIKANPLALERLDTLLSSPRLITTFVAKNNKKPPGLSIEQVKVCLEECWGRNI